MFSREEAFNFLNQNIKDANLIRHCVATEGVLQILARHFGQDENLWGITGLLHDVDYEFTKETPDLHGLKAGEMLEGKLPEESIYAIKAHNWEMTKVEPKSELDWALRCGETITGLILAAAYVRPTKLEGMKAKSLKKKMKDKSFAASVNRDTIRECSKLGLELGEFLALAIKGVQNKAKELGLE
ncbi:HDIG domain-containing metalloprotein [Desulfonauticus submarinus]|uniref:HD domain-containing protein n=1 Tax=Desulfonauticus submarinus TaxID=206665 RepID=A0A1H0C0I1_9BACT|nr:HDIG domain-containing metalloprotein [Desulfonauticus submarinus]SDN51421.1 hypothetical protein SAMN04488516_102360 [Desulfonauticus submarinus]